MKKMNASNRVLMIGLFASVLFGAAGCEASLWNWLLGKPSRDDVQKDIKKNFKGLTSNFDLYLTCKKLLSPEKSEDFGNKVVKDFASLGNTIFRLSETDEDLAFHGRVAVSMESERWKESLGSQKSLDDRREFVKEYKDVLFKNSEENFFDCWRKNSNDLDGVRKCLWNHDELNRMVWGYSVRDERSSELFKKYPEALWGYYKKLALRETSRHHYVYGESLIPYINSLFFNMNVPEGAKEKLNDDCLQELRNLRKKWIADHGDILKPKEFETFCERSFFPSQSFYDKDFSLITSEKSKCDRISFAWAEKEKLKATVLSCYSRYIRGKEKADIRDAREAFDKAEKTSWRELSRERRQKDEYLRERSEAHKKVALEKAKKVAEYWGEEFAEKIEEAIENGEAKEYDEPKENLEHRGLLLQLKDFRDLKKI